MIRTMNKFYFTVVFILSFSFSFAAPIIKSVKTGYWNQATTWSLNRVPQAGDSIVITVGSTVTIDADETLSSPSFLKINGKLYFENMSSSLSLADNSFVWVFAGGMIQGVSASQKLRLNSNIIFSGNQDPVYGPMMASTTSGGFAAMVNSVPVVLPVKFVSFTVSLKNNNALVQWSTAEEKSAMRFDIERSADGHSWSTIGSVAANGNNSSANVYSYADNNIATKTAYYRVKEVDVNGAAMYSTTAAIKTGVATSADVKIASISNRLLLQFPSQVTGNVVVRFLNMSGQVVDQQQLSNPAGQIVMNTSFSGNYIISISNGRNIRKATQVIL
jgi:hypothetical protein